MHALNHIMHRFEMDDGFVMVVGPSTTGLMLEIGYVARRTDRQIIHAMPARPKYLRRA